MNDAVINVHATFTYFGRCFIYLKLSKEFVTIPSY